MVAGKGIVGLEIKNDDEKEAMDMLVMMAEDQILPALGAEEEELIEPIYKQLGNYTHQLTFAVETDTRKGGLGGGFYCRIIVSAKGVYNMIASDTKEGRAFIDESQFTIDE